jgi:hypothetical protein
LALRSSVPRATALRERPAVPRGLLVAIVVALIFGLTGVVFLGLMLGERNAVAGSVSAGGLTLQVQSAQWVDLEHNSQDGFQMPQQMMPGAPSPDQQRLAVEVAVSNRSGRATLLSHSEFSVQSSDGQVWPLVADDLGGSGDDAEGAFDGLRGTVEDSGAAAVGAEATRLGPGLAVNGSLSFDLPAATVAQAGKGLVLLWSRAGKVVRVPMTVGAAPAHVH